MAKQRVLFVALCLDYGGAERHLSMVMPALAERGWPITVYCTNRLGAFTQDVRRGGVEVIGPPVEADARTTGRLKRMLYAIFAGARLFRVMRKLKPEVVHFFLPEPYMIGAPISLLQRAPIRVMSRRSLNLYQRQWPGVRKIEGRLHQRMTAVLGNSRAVVDDLIGEHVAPSRIGLIYNGVALDAYEKPFDRGAFRKSLGFSDNDFVMTMVANMSPRKAHSDAVEALALAASRMQRPWTLLCAGRDDGCQERLQAQIEQKGLQHRIRLLGERADVPDLLRASDMGVLTSHEEGFSNAILESMAAGLPMVVTNVGGNTEAIADGSSGLVVPPADPAALADAIVRLAEDPALAAALGAGARRRVREHFSNRACVDRYEALYTGLLAGRPVNEIALVHASVVGPDARATQMLAGK
jgi:glycosyltransferase involved in cell wall biosynthesis